MVYGLETFKRWFEGYEGRFVIIGGTACNLIYSTYGAPERATQDIDLVILVEAFDAAFYERFLEFLKAGGYSSTERLGRSMLYRFVDPVETDFPRQLELLSRRPEFLEGLETRLGRFKTIDGSESLSAILLDSDYYDLLEEGIVTIEGLPVLSLLHLPVFKIHAWMNLSSEKDAGLAIQSDDMNKHRRDILKLCALIEPGSRLALVDDVRSEVESFVSKRPWDEKLMRSLRLGMSADDMAALIRAVYL